MKVKVWSLLGIMLALVLGACSAHSAMSLTFQVETKDQVKVTLDTTDTSYQLQNGNGQFHVKEDDTIVISGMFVTKEGYDKYKLNRDKPDVKVIEEKTEKGLTYFLFEQEREQQVERFYVAWLDGSNTGVIIGGIKDLSIIQDAFQRLTIEVVE